MPADRRASSSLLKPGFVPGIVLHFVLNYALASRTPPTYLDLHRPPPAKPRSWNETRPDA